MSYKYKEDERARKRAYRQENIESIRLKEKVRVRSETTKAKAVVAKHAQDPRTLMLNAAKGRADKYGLEFNIDVNDIVVPEFCPITDIKLFRNLGGRQTRASPSLDRIDNSKGYIKGNVAVISMRANNHKSDLSLREIKNLYCYSIQQQEEMEECE